MVNLAFIMDGAFDPLQIHTLHIVPTLRDAHSGRVSKADCIGEVRFHLTGMRAGAEIAMPSEPKNHSEAIS